MVEQYRSARYEGILDTSGLLDAQPHVRFLALSGARLTHNKRVVEHPTAEAWPGLICTALPEIGRCSKMRKFITQHDALESHTE